MTLRFAVSAAALALLSACGGNGAGNSSAPAAPVAAVAAPAGQDWTQVVSKTADGGYLMGNPDAAIKLVEYGSRTCPTCGAFGQTGMKPLEENYVKTGKVSYEFRDFLVHAPDLGVAALGECVGEAPFFPLLEQMYVEQPKFLEKLEKLPTDFQQKLQAMTPAQQATAWVEYLGYLDFVKQRGVTEAQARACLADGKKLEAIAKITEAGMQQHNVTGTPSFFLNGKPLEGSVTWPQIEAALKNAGA
ncbi:thioredoxin domain-containing protein [uncultured Sphingomonas sp.]|uniref:DsbA family protein n=1 Tax=uncultured Sphingomonas sp. TaxID=158754 RepID=UPI0026056265|nr:thioredoxin domain-containing protein [uncultured Sphingomonas sp.]